MRRLLLIEFDLQLIHHILNDTDWIIEVFVDPNCLSNDSIRNHPRVKEILRINDFIYNNDYNYFSYDDMKKMSYAQLKAENSFNRSMVDYAYGKLYYYRGYALAQKIFSEHSIDLVLVTELMHGHTCDRLLCEMAMMKGIPCYSFEPASVAHRILVNNNTEQLVSSAASEKVNIDDATFYKQDVNLLIKKKENFIKRYIKSKLYHHFGVLGEDFIGCIRKRNFNCGNDFYQKTSYWYKLRHHLYFLYANRYLEKISVGLDIGEKYIYYSLHLEPEATVDGRSVMNSQIVAIQLLSSVLPEGWIIYVKEHPMQLQTNTRLFSGFMRSDGVYKNRLYYEDISKIKNVKFLKTHTNNRTIIEHARAVASLSGTITLEAISMKKPAFVFNPERTIYRYMKDVFCVTSFTDCLNAMEKLKDEFVPKYSDFDEVSSRYYFESNSKGCRVALKSLQVELKLAYLR